MAVKVKRYDSLDPGRWMTDPFSRTTEGFLSGRAIVTSIGVFSYRNADGSLSRELRLPEEVFDSESLFSMKLKPVTNGHPTEKVTSANAKELVVGNLGSNPSSTTQEKTWDGGYTPWDKLTDGLHVAIDMTINQEGAIEEVLNGKRSLSMGYECEMEKAEEGATWLGMAYDSIQRNIRYNHCAIVDVARAGDAARIRLDGKDQEAGNIFGIHLDSGDAIRIDIKPSGETGGNQAKHQEVNTMKYRLDNGMEYDAPEGFVQAYVSMKEKADNADKAITKEREDHKTAISKLEAERDTAKDRADKAENEAKKAKEDAAISPDRVKAAAKEMAALYDAADRAGVEVKNDMANMDIKKAVITAIFPKADLKDKDAAYISARYDSALEMLENRADAESCTVVGEVPSAKTRTDSASARNRMIELNRRLSRGEKGAT
ncbi:MAG: DUF2213 domain-containing protein [Treponema sp.]|jgi:hypothetical protein|nr:DUF2213 domain-containing protein [Treponema sp.]